MPKCFFQTIPSGFQKYYLRTFYLVVGLLWLPALNLCAQQFYQCTLKVYQEGLNNQKVSQNHKLKVLVEKYEDNHLVGFLGQLKLDKTKKQPECLSFVMTSDWNLRLNFQPGFGKKIQVFKVSNDSAQFRQTKKVPLDKKSFLVMELTQEPITKEEAKKKERLQVVSTVKKVQGISGVLVKVRYVLPPGVKSGVGYVRALMGKRSVKPVWIYRVDKNKRLVNDLVIRFKDTTRFKVFVPFHERPYWQPTIGFQITHNNLGRLLENFRVSDYSNSEETADVTGKLFLRATSTNKIQPQGVHMGLKFQLPNFYMQDLRRNQMTLHLTGKIEPMATAVWHYKMYLVEKLNQLKNEIVVRESFVPYAWLAKYTDTLEFNLKAKLFLMAHRGVQFYNGYPRQQSHRVGFLKDKIALVLPPMHSLKIRPVFFKYRQAISNQKQQANIQQLPALHLSIRIKKYELYRSRDYDYKKNLRFFKVNKETLRLSKNDEVIIELKDNAYRPKVYFQTKLQCTADILKQKSWKLKDKYGNYLKIAVQNLTTKKDKLTHTNGKKQTKMLGGSR